MENLISPLVCLLTYKIVSVVSDSLEFCEKGGGKLLGVDKVRRRNATSDVYSQKPRRNFYLKDSS